MIKQQQHSLFHQDEEETPLKKELLTIFIDGASRGNPGLSGAGIYGINHHGHEVLTQGFYLGIKTNNQAEYLALAIASVLIHEILDAKKPQKILFVADSQLLVRQMQGIYKVKNPVIKNIKHFVDNRLRGLDYSFKHVLREYNVNADKYANLGVDQKKKLPQSIALEFNKEPLSLGFK